MTKYTFADGYTCWVRKMNRAELAYNTQLHGKLINKIVA